MAVLAIDQGTSGTKAVVVDDDGTVLSIADRAVRPDYRAGGVVEQDPLELLDSVMEAGRQAAAGHRIDVVSLANQGETVLAWDRESGRPLSSAIVWQDGRAQSVCDRLSDARGLVEERTGLVLDPYFSAPKMTWLRENVTRDGVVTTSDAWLLHALTGAFVTDVTTASRSLIMDVDQRCWDARLLDTFSLSDEDLPRIVDCDETVGVTSMLGGEVPVAGVIVDQQAALLAERCLVPGMVKCTYGTGAFLLANTGDRAARSTGGLTTSVAWVAGGTAAYCLDGQVFTASSAIRWLVDIGLLSAAEQLDAEGAADAGEVTCVPALAGMGAPWWRSDARARISGLSLGTQRGNIVRAVIEGIAAQVAVLCDAMAVDMKVGVAALRVDGGLTRSHTLMQAQADLLQVPVEVYPSAHATAMGAAAVGRLAMNPGLTLDEAAWTWEPEARYEPQWSRDRADDMLGRWTMLAAAT